MQYEAIERRIYFFLSKSMTFAHDRVSIEERKRRSKTRRGRERTNAPRSSLVRIAARWERSNGTSFQL